MAYKAVISDFDGTLAGRDHVVSDRVVETIRKVIDSGVVFTIGTGRMYYGVLEEQIKRMGLKVPIIVRGGAEIFDPVKEETLSIRYIPNEDIDGIVKLLRDRNLHLFVEKGAYYYTVGGEIGDHSQANQVKDLDMLDLVDIPKVVAIGEVEREYVEGLIEELKERFPNSQFTLTGTEPHIGIDINGAGVTKHLAVLEWEKMMEIPRDEIIGIGDSYNDYGLLEACGLKVAMGNAREELKGMADWVAPGLEDDGVAVMLEKYLLNDEAS